MSDECMPKYMRMRHCVYNMHNSVKGVCERVCICACECVHVCVWGEDLLVCMCLCVCVCA